MNANNLWVMNKIESIIAIKECLITMRESYKVANIEQRQKDGTNKYHEQDFFYIAQQMLELAEQLRELLGKIMP